VLWLDPIAGTITAERVQFPDTWTPMMIQAANVIVPKDSDFFAVMTAQRQAGYTVTDILLESITSFEITHNGPTPQASDRVRVALSLVTESGDPVDLLVTAGMTNHVEPTS